MQYKCHIHSKSLHWTEFGKKLSNISNYQRGTWCSWKYPAINDFCFYHILWICLMCLDKPMSLVKWGHTKLKIENWQSNKTATVEQPIVNVFLNKITYFHQLSSIRMCIKQIMQCYTSLTGFYKD